MKLWFHSLSQKIKTIKKNLEKLKKITGQLFKNNDTFTERSLRNQLEMHIQRISKRTQKQLLITVSSIHKKKKYIQNLYKSLSRKAQTLREVPCAHGRLSEI